MHRASLPGSSTGSTLVRVPEPPLTPTVRAKMEHSVLLLLSPPGRSTDMKVKRCGAFVVRLNVTGPLIGTRARSLEAKTSESVNRALEQDSLEQIAIRWNRGSDPHRVNLLAQKI